MPRAIAITPLNLVLQLILLPLYLWLMADASPASWDWATLAPAVLIVLVPLAGAVLAERWIEAHPKAEGSRDTMAWWPVPLLALMVFLIAVAQVGTVVETIGELQKMVPVFVLFLVAAALLAKVIAVQLRLPVEQGRTLVGPRPTEFIRGPALGLVAPYWLGGGCGGHRRAVAGDALWHGGLRR